MENVNRSADDVVLNDIGRYRGKFAHAIAGWPSAPWECIEVFAGLVQLPSHSPCGARIELPDIFADEFELP
jgi:hypothetical protein